MISSLVDRKAHDTDSSIQSVDVAFGLEGFVSCVVPNVVPLSSCPACHLTQMMILRKACSLMSSIANAGSHCEPIAISVVILPKLNDVHIRHSGHVQILCCYEILLWFHPLFMSAASSSVSSRLTFIDIVCFIVWFWLATSSISIRRAHVWSLA